MTREARLIVIGLVLVILALIGEGCQDRARHSVTGVLCDVPGVARIDRMVSGVYDAGVFDTVTARADIDVVTVLSRRKSEVIHLVAGEKLVLEAYEGQPRTLVGPDPAEIHVCK